MPNPAESGPARTRAGAARLLSRIIVRKQTTDQVLGDNEQDPLLLELLYGSLRHYFSLGAAVDQSLRHPLRLKDHDVWCLMVVGLYQLHHLRIPPHAALHETVEAARLLGKPWAKALVNAVLRNAPTPERSFEHPAWMQRLLKDAYGELAAQIMVANNERAPMALRINVTRVRPDDYKSRLAAAGLSCRALSDAFPAAPAWGPETVILDQPIPARQLPGYREGLVSVQDAGAQLAASLFCVTPTTNPVSAEPMPSRLLDACAAPGGKLFHLLERAVDLEAVAVDNSSARLDTLRREANRLGLTRYTAIVGDATALDWWNGQQFDQVLVDAPCSGSGTLRRHPDIKILRQASDLPRYAALQGALLESLWQVVKPGGTLIYCTCSIFPAENDAVIDPFLNRHADAAVEFITLPTGQATHFGWQLLPLDADTDGFYFARLRKALQ
jgi:16S rRNA (cytosine967-C5)-methyltransferase